MLGILLSSGMALAISGNADSSDDQKIPKSVQIALKKRLPVDRAIDVAASMNAEPRELEAVYSVGAGEYTAGYVLPESDSMPSSQEITQTMIGWFKQDRKLLKTTVGSDDKAARKTISELNAVINRLQGGEAKIAEMTVATSTPTTKLERNFNVQSANDVDALTRQRAEADEVTFSPQNYGTDYNWTPKRGYVSTRCCSYERRYTYQNFKWNSWRMGKLKNKSRHPLAFEAESTYMRENGTYLGRLVGHSSNLPQDYRDTEFSDFSNTRTVAIGTTGVKKLRANRYYYGLIRATRGRDHRETGGMNAQYGRRTYGCRGGAWCMLRPSATDIVLRATVGYRVPGSKSWQSGS